MTENLRIGIYPGTFDPITNGHLDILNRAKPLFDKVIMTLAVNSSKTPLFSIEERIQMISEAIKDLKGVEIDQFSGLVVNYARKVNARTIIRGLRAISDFEYEFLMALMNRKQNPRIDTVYFMPDEKYTYLSSSIVREVAHHGGDVDCFVPEHVSRMLKKKFGHL